WPLAGWLKGDAYYKGRPTSYWSQKIRFIHEAWTSGRPSTPIPLADRFRNSFEFRDIDNEEKEANTLAQDAAAIPVLLALLKDDVPGVRAAAVYLLDKMSPPPQEA